MPTNEHRRAAAKRKLERQLVRRAERARRRRTITIVVTVVVLVVLVGGIYGLTKLGGSSANASGSTPTTTTTPAPPPKSSSGACKYTTTPQEPAPKGKDVGLPTDPAKTPKTGTVRINLKTSQGTIPVTLDRAKAPCTVQSFAFLAEKKFFDNTPCHRETAHDTLKVLQCGDPTGKGNGGPGFTIPDEKPKGLKAAPVKGKQQPGAPKMMIYPRGVLAMANTGQPNSGGSQFFLVYANSQLPADYTIFGTVSAGGLSVLDKIAHQGITPGTNPQTGQPDPQDGAPKKPVTIASAMVS